MIFFLSFQMIPCAAWKTLFWENCSIRKKPNSPQVLKQNATNLLVTDPDGVKNNVN